MIFEQNLVKILQLSGRFWSQELLHVLYVGCIGNRKFGCSFEPCNAGDSTCSLPCRRLCQMWWETQQFDCHAEEFVTHGSGILVPMHAGNFATCGIYLPFWLPCRRLNILAPKQEICFVTCGRLNILPPMRETCERVVHTRASSLVSLHLLATSVRLFLSLPASATLQPSLDKRIPVAAPIPELPPAQQCENYGNSEQVELSLCVP